MSKNIRMKVSDELHRLLKASAAWHATTLHEVIRAALEQHAARFVRDSGMKAPKEQAK